MLTSLNISISVPFSYFLHLCTTYLAVFASPNTQWDLNVTMILDNNTQWDLNVTMILDNTINLIIQIPDYTVLRTFPVLTNANFKQKALKIVDEDIFIYSMHVFE